MGISSKHFYRFNYLKSEEWQGVRKLRLAQDKGECCICHRVNWNNDAHHHTYPSRIWDTTPKHLVTLCRSCHTMVHEVFGDDATRVKWPYVMRVIKRLLMRDACIVCRARKDLTPIADFCRLVGNGSRCARNIAKTADQVEAKACPSCLTEIVSNVAPCNRKEFWLGVHSLRAKLN